VAGLSERIRVRSIVGEFLEHSRVFGFANGGAAESCLGSADLMERDLDRRVEVVVPVEDADARARVEELIAVLLADDRNAWLLGPDGAWSRADDQQGHRARSTRSSSARPVRSRAPTRPAPRSPDRSRRPPPAACPNLNGPALAAGLVALAGWLDRRCACGLFRCWIVRQRIVFC
jgi:hypothetical protein